MTDEQKQKYKDYQKQYRERWVKCVKKPDRV